MPKADPKQHLHRTLTEMVGKSIQVLDYTQEVYRESSLRKRYPDPAQIWQKVNKVRNTIPQYDFTYLFDCIADLPESSLVPANKKLITSYLEGTLGTHLGAFNALTSAWLQNLPSTVGSHTNMLGGIYSGCISMELLYKHLIMAYFVQESIQPAQYFENIIRGTDFRTKPLAESLEQLRLQYSMQQFISGTLNEHTFGAYVDLLYDKFNEYSDTAEHEIAMNWSRHQKNYSDAMNAAPYCDAFLWLLHNIETFLTRVKRFTIHEKYVNGTLPESNLHGSYTPAYTWTPLQQKGKNPRQPRPPKEVKLALADSAPASDDTPTQTKPPSAPRVPPDFNNFNLPRCPCGLNNHEPNQCKRKDKWKNLPEGVRKYFLAYFVAPDVHSFDPQAAARQGKGGRGGYHNQGSRGGHHNQGNRNAQNQQQTTVTAQSSSVPAQAQSQIQSQPSHPLPAAQPITTYYPAQGNQLPSTPTSSQPAGRSNSPPLQSARQQPLAFMPTPASRPTDTSTHNRFEVLT